MRVRSVEESARREAKGSGWKGGRGGEGKGDRVDAEEQSHRFKLKPGNTREGETFAGLSGLITPGTDSI